MNDKAKALKIRQLNTEFRKTLQGGIVAFVGALGTTSPNNIVLQHKILAVARFAEVTEGNDPYGEADFGKVEIDGESFFWMIDYYDLAMEFGSPDPADPAVTKRVLSIFYASDY